MEWGGHVGGDTASKLAVTTVEEIVRENSEIFLKKDSSQSPNTRNPVARLLSDALRGACHEVHQLGSQVVALQGMGTTTTALLIDNNYAFVAHVGDSRAYLVRDKKISQLSDDHSLVNEQVKAGLITASQARTSRLRNIITRSIGFEDDVDVDMIALPIKKKDTLLLCSDGLTAMVTDLELEHVLTQNPLPQTPQILIDLANKRGGDDNITAIIVSIGDQKDSAKK